MKVINFFSELFRNSKERYQKTTSNKIKQIEIPDSNTMYFAIPTLENALPEFDNQYADSDLQMHEDDWRQVEFISKDKKELILKEIKKIKNIYDNESFNAKDFTVFKSASIRELIKHPLNLSFEKIQSYLSPNPLKINGISINNFGHVNNGISFLVNDINFYGILNNHIITTLGIQSIYKKNLKYIIDNITDLLESEELYLVDWVKMVIIDEKSVKDNFINNYS